VEESKNMKETLSASQTAQSELESLYEGIDFQATISREQLEKMTEALYPLLIRPIKDILEGIPKAEVSGIELFGGMTRLPKVYEILGTFGIPLGRHVNSDEAAVFGAAHYAAVLKNVPQVLKVIVNEVPPAPTSQDKVVIPLSQQQLHLSKKILEELDTASKMREESIQAKNALESYVIESKDQIQSNTKLKETEKRKVLDALQVQSNFLDDNMEVLPAENYLQRLRDIKAVVDEHLPVKKLEKEEDKKSEKKKKTQEEKEFDEAKKKRVEQMKSKQKKNTENQKKEKDKQKKKEEL